MKGMLLFFGMHICKTLLFGMVSLLSANNIASNYMLGITKIALKNTKKTIYCKVQPSKLVFDVLPLNVF